MESKVIFLIVIATISVMLMAFGVVYFVLLYRRKMLENQLELKSIESKYQREMLNSSLRSQEAERNRLGSDLHDSVGAMLSSIKLNLEVSKRRKSIEMIDNILSNIDETIKQVRNISHQMMPIVLKKYGIKKAIADLFEKVSNQELHAEIQYWDEFSLSKENELLLYRIVQELVNNSLKHASASKLLLEAKSDDNKIFLSYWDNGNGYPDKILSKNDGLGLSNIISRSQALNAEVIIKNKEGLGAQTDLVIPLINL